MCGGNDGIVESKYGNVSSWLLLSGAGGEDEMERIDFKSNNNGEKSFESR